MGIISRFPGGVGVQSDWNQNDETAPDYVKNRPFYTGNPVETVLVEESTVSFSFVEDNGLYTAQVQSTFAPTVGETYKVYWDGTAYECVCVDAGDVPAIGNLSIAGLGSDTGEPFVIAKGDVETITIGAADTSASHTFSISRIVQEVVKIDPKYIRDMYYTGDPVETVLVEESTVSFSFSENEGVYMGRLESTFSATVGETYKVSWDGTVYECVCAVFNRRPVIGNLSIIGAGSDTGEPFLMMVHNGVGIAIGTADTSASHTFSISGFVQEVVKIDGKYLPDTVATKSEVEAAQAMAETAQSTAETAQSTADTAQSTADVALDRADTAKTAAENAQTTADAALPKSGGEMSGVIKSSSSIEFPRKYSSNSSPIGGLIISSNIASKVLTNEFRSKNVDSSLFSHIETIVTCLDGITIYNPNKITNMKTVIISAEGERLDFLSVIGKKPITISAKDIILQSSTANSTKQFRITVDDSGTLKATEVS